MKKISLKNLNLEEVEQLSREQLKNVLGGYTGGTGGGDTETETTDPPKEKCNCNNSDQCKDPEKPDCAGQCDPSGTSYYGHCVNNK